MDHNREKGRGWRIEMGLWLKNNLGVIPLDPYNKPVHADHLSSVEDDDNFAKREKAMADGDYDTVSECMKPVVSTDLRMVDHSDFILVNFDIDSHPCGTFDEIFMAADENKPVVLMCPNGKKSIYQWMFGRLKHKMFFESWEQVQEYLSHIAFDEKIETHNKWKFFDIEDTIMEIVGQEHVVISPKEYAELLWYKHDYMARDDGCMFGGRNRD
jgi:hypothetical protein